MTGYGLVLQMHLSYCTDNSGAVEEKKRLDHFDLCKYLPLLPLFVGWLLEKRILGDCCSVCVHQMFKNIVFLNCLDSNVG